MQRKIIFKDSNTEVLLPVTPQSISIEHGINIETINIDSLGDVNIAGNGKLATINISCEFPAQLYPYAFYYQDPYELVKTFEKWIDDKKPLRFIVSDTPINIAVKVQSIDYAEQDGTNDIYATIILREYREIVISRVGSFEIQNKDRPLSSPPVKALTYTIVRGDTLSAICRKFYGDASLYPKLAAVNNIKNPHLIYTGNILTIPDKSQL